MEVEGVSIHYGSSYRENAHKHGLCISCLTKPASVNSSRCLSCLEICRKQALKRYRSNRKKELCNCGRKPRKGLKTCQLCYDRLLEHRDKRLKLGYCSRCVCRMPVEGKKLCLKCLEYAKKKGRN
jgi:hypothetical protein